MAKRYKEPAGLQLPLFPPSTKDWTPVDLNTLPEWKDAKRICLDLETRDRGIERNLGPGHFDKDSYTAGFAFSIEDGPSYYLPIRHEGGDNLPVENVLRYMRGQAKNFKGELLGMNFGYDLGFCSKDGIEFSNSPKMMDVQMAAVLCNELQRSYSLDNICKRLGIEGKSEQVLKEAASAFGLKNPKSDMWRLPGRYVSEYGIQDTIAPIMALRRLERQLDDEDLWKVWDLECNLIPVLHKVRQRGVRIDLDKLEQVEKYTLQQEKEALAEVQRRTGVEIPLNGVWTADNLAPVFQKLGYKVPKTPKTKKPSIDKSFLNAVGKEHEVGGLILWARKVNKLRTTFAKSIRNHLSPDGRIHCQFNQMAYEGEGTGGPKGARFGRMSSEHPNLQQQPSRDEFAEMWRSIYIPEEGQQWACLDYSGQEPRMTTHFSIAANCQRAYEAEKRYHENPDADDHQMMADMTGLSRKNAKDLGLAITYSQGSAATADKLGLPTQIITTKAGRKVRVAGPEAQAIIDEYDSKAPWIRELSNRCQAAAKRRGYVKTLLGRRCRFEQDAEGNYEWTYRALNRVIQGSAGDQTKMAMLEADRAGYPIQLQVHDELDLSVPNRKYAEGCAEIMKTCVKLRIPSKVDVEIGPSWGEIK